MTVSLAPELEHYIAVKMESGRYRSASDVVEQALRLLEERDQKRAAEIAAFDQELGRRLAALDRGEWVDPRTIRERIGSPELRQLWEDAQGDTSPGLEPDEVLNELESKYQRMVDLTPSRSDAG